MVFWRRIIFGQLWSNHFFWNVGCFGVRFPLNTTVFFNVYIKWWTLMLSTLVETQTEDRQEKSVSQKKTHATLVNKPFKLWSVKHNGEEEMQNPQGKSVRTGFLHQIWGHGPLRSPKNPDSPGFFRGTRLITSYLLMHIGSIWWWLIEDKGTRLQDTMHQSQPACYTWLLRKTGNSSKNSGTPKWN